MRYLASMSKSKVNIGRVFKQFIWPRKKLIFVGLLLVLISRVASFVLPYSIRVLVDDIGTKKVVEDTSFGTSLGLNELLTLVILAVTIQAVTSFLLTKLLSVEAQRLISQLRSKVQQQILQLPIRFFDDNQSGALVSRIMTDVEGVRNLVGTGLVQLFGGILTSIGSFVFLLSINVTMTLSVLIPMAIFGIVSSKAFGKIRPIFRDRGKINSEVTGRLTETLNGVRVIKGFNAEAQEVKTFQHGVERLFLNVKESLTFTSLLTSSGSFLIGLASVIIMGIGAGLLINGELKPGEFMSFMAFLAMMVAPILQMSNIGSQLTEGFAGLDRTEELMNMAPEDNPEVRNIVLNEIHGDIIFDNVSYAYEDNKNVVRGVSFEALSGTVTALVGTSGSGKSTIAGLAASFLEPAGGNITVDGTDITQVNLSSYRKNLGVVLQDDFLFEGTIRENVLFPRPNATEEELQSAIKAAHVHEFTDRFEEGLETVIGERGVKLSGGQRQRLAIARAILANPKILILDEATSNLDTESEALIQQSLKGLMKGRTTFVIAHRLSTIRQADQILVIEEGKIAERGKHDELIEQKGRYFDLYTYQARI